MTREVEHLQLQGGLDEASDKTNPPPGRLLSCQNFEVVFGQSGYRRIDGYERFDGKALASVADYKSIAFNVGSTTPTVGDTLQTATGTAILLRINLTSGSWAGGDATGAFIVTATTGTFTAGQAITVSGGYRAACNSSLIVSSQGDSSYTSDISLAREYYRGLIAKPTGEGAILGVKLMDGVVYCLRNVVGSATATLWKSTASGWSAVRTGLRPGGSLNASISSFSGASGRRLLFGADGKNRYWQYNPSTLAFTFGPAVYGSEGTSTTSVTPGSGAKIFTVTEASRDWVAGDELLIYSSSDASKFMIGTVTTWVAPTLTINCTSFGGGNATDWHICRNDGIDRPFIAYPHRNYLWLAYPFGQLQSSDVGDPLSVTATAQLFGVSEDIRGLASVRGEVLVVAHSSGVSLIYGSAATAEKKFHSTDANIAIGSLFEIAGNAIYASDNGIKSLSGSQSFGDFDASSLSRKAFKTFNSLISGYKCASVIRKSNQYRIYGKSSGVLVMTWPGAYIQERYLEFTKLQYLHQPVCSDSEVSGDEFVVFGTDDGWVMKERSGTTFDGSPIQAYFRTTYWHSKMPDVVKRVRKLQLEAETTAKTNISIRLDFDFSDTGVPTQAKMDRSLPPVGSVWSEGVWSQMVWSSAEVSISEIIAMGTGRYMSVAVQSLEDTPSFRVFGVGVHFSPLKVKKS